MAVTLGAVKVIRDSVRAIRQPFARPQHVNGTSGPSGEGNPGGYWGNG